MILVALMLLAAAPDMSAKPDPAQTDLSQMSVEDAVMLMFEMISKDARKDTRAMLSEMDQARKKRSAMREAEAEMAKEMRRLKALSSSSTGAQSNSIARGQVEWANQLPALCGHRVAEDRARCIEEAIGKRTAQLRSMPSPK
jgi:hypothetical protein